MSELENGRKIKKSFTNQFDNYLIHISDNLSPYFKRIGYTPNGITTISLILGLASLYHLYHHQPVEFGIYFILAYLFDCMDGHYARKYDMITEGGDKYDHYKDFALIIAVIYVIFTRYEILDHPIVLIVLITFGILGTISTGCIERHSSKNHQSDTLKLIDAITPSKETCVKHREIFRFFGTGTLVIIFVIAVYYMNVVTSSDEQTVNEEKFMIDTSRIS